MDVYIQQHLYNELLCSLYEYVHAGNMVGSKKLVMVIISCIHILVNKAINTDMTEPNKAHKTA